MSSTDPTSLWRYERELIEREDNTTVYSSEVPDTPPCAVNDPYSTLSDAYQKYRAELERRAAEFIDTPLSFEEWAAGQGITVPTTSIRPKPVPPKSTSRVIRVGRPRPTESPAAAARVDPPTRSSWEQKLSSLPTADPAVTQPSKFPRGTDRYARLGK